MFVLGWLPLVLFVAVGIALGVVIARAPQRMRRGVLAAPLVLGGTTAVLVVLSPPCPDLLDGPCEQNWVSGTSAVTFMLTLLAVLAAVAMFVTAHVRARSQR